MYGDISRFLYFSVTSLQLYCNRNVLDEENDGPVTDMKVLRKYAADILSGLVLLHRSNIIHGDLKPVTHPFAWMTEVML